MNAVKKIVGSSCLAASTLSAVFSVAIPAGAVARTEKYVRGSISNQTDCTLVLMNQRIDGPGRWASSPPSYIEPYGSVAASAAGPGGQSFDAFMDYKASCSRDGNGIFLTLGIGLNEQGYEGATVSAPGPFSCSDADLPSSAGDPIAAFTLRKCS
ncbi:hypothetical protein [Actinoplanes sp. HUAS TT8]|uniref:hypothetical protein n=1 Tax=Actinoplanes sp. HUAS TT8 TaxID=3447453 RepID=UPI003F524A6C